jgi:hypothetical protein
LDTHVASVPRETIYDEDPETIKEKEFRAVQAYLDDVWEAHHTAMVATTLVTKRESAPVDQAAIGGTAGPEELEDDWAASETE